MLAHQLIFAQTSERDSLVELLAKSVESTKHVDVLNSLASVSPNPDSLLRVSIALSQKLNYEEGLVTAYNLLANELTDEGKYDSALTLSFYNLNVRKSKAPSDKLASTYSAIGLLYDYKGDYENAMSYFLEGLKISEGIEDKQLISDFYNRIGIIYNYQKNYDKTLEYFEKSLVIRKEIGDQQGQADMYNNIGIIYGKLNDIDKAIEYYSISLNTKKQLDDRASIAISYNNLGTAYFFKNEYKKALEYYKESLKIKLEENLPGDMASTYINIGETLTYLKDYKNALINIKRGVSLAQDMGNRDDIKLGYEELAQTYAEMNNFREAYEYHVLYNILKDSIFNAESDERIVEMQTKYDLDKKEQEIALLQKENEIKRIETENSNFIRNIFIIGFIAISFLIAAIIRSYRRDLVKNLQLTTNKKKIESQNEVLKAMSYEKDQLMKIVAHDLRSPLNQVEGLVNLVNLSPENLNNEQKEALASVTIATKHSKELISKILTTKSIDPSKLKVNIESIDIHELILATIKSQELNSNRKKINFHLDVPSENSKALTDINYAEQIFENLISNAIKFSPHEKNIYVKIADKSDSLRIEVKDEGPGLTPEDKKKLFGVYEKLSATPTGGETSIGLGLSIVKKYIDIVNGKVWCESEEGQGATFIVELRKA